LVDLNCILLAVTPTLARRKVCCLPTFASAYSISQSRNTCEKTKPVERNVVHGGKKLQPGSTASRTLVPTITPETVPTFNQQLKDGMRPQIIGQVRKYQYPCTKAAYAASDFRGTVDSPRR
jgi:hypothetical protein